jgi:acid phosphatase (class A)
MKSTIKNSASEATFFGKSRMSLSVIVVICSLAISNVAGQPNVIRKNVALDARDRPLTPARGHYKQLASISRERSWNTELDKMTYPSTPTDSKWFDKKPIYLVNVSKEEFNIPPPPANSSDQTRAELNYLINLAKHRTSEDVAESHYMSKVYYNINTIPSDTAYHRYRDNLFFIGHSIGNWFSPTELPLTADLLANVCQDVNYFLWTFKLQYARMRPYMLDRRVNNLEEADAPSYPGGHATSSYVLAYLYQELAPEFTDVFVKGAYDMAHSREIIGVHYPSDSEVSRNLARQLVNKLLQNEKFLQDFAKVKKEWNDKAMEKLGN